MADRTQRPIVPATNSDESEHRRQLAERANASFPKDGTERMTSPLKLQEIVLADLPAASTWSGALVYVTDETGGAVPAFSDGTDWRRVTDRAIAS